MFFELLKYRSSVILLVPYHTLARSLMSDISDIFWQWFVHRNIYLNQKALAHFYLFSQRRLFSQWQLFLNADDFCRNAVSKVRYGKIFWRNAVSKQRYAKTLRRVTQIFLRNKVSKLRYAKILRRVTLIFCIMQDLNWVTHRPRRIGGRICIHPKYSTLEDTGLRPFVLGVAAG